MNQQYEQLQKHWERQMALKTALTLISWDNETLAPSAAGEYTSKVVGILSDELFAATVNEEVASLLESLSGAKDLTDLQADCVKKLKEEYDDYAVIPREENKAFSELMAVSTLVWAKAKRNNDYQAFIPTLKEVISFEKKFAGYRKKGQESLYETLLNQYEKGFCEADLDRFFGKLKEEIVPLLKKVNEKSDIVTKPFEGPVYPVDIQKKWNLWLAEYVGLDPQKGIMAESEHPFSTNLHNHDVRITNHFKESVVDDSIFSTIHETGHALYEEGIADELTQTPLGYAISMSMHESQSRFFENMIGRSEAFWIPIYSKLQEAFPEQLGDVSMEAFVKGINKVQPGLIRIKADELTYSLHIMIRYEIEKKMINGEVDLEELPKLWADLYEEYLGIRPENDTEGVLQDIHWSQGYIGYFPSYALGNAYAAQIYAAMNKVLNVEELLKEGNIEPIRAFLREHIHKDGCRKTSKEVLKSLTGEEFNPDYYIAYLKEKYTKLYQL